jgi:lysophospholipase L1-like esterase
MLLGRLIHMIVMNIYRILLGPVLVVQGRHLRRMALRLPEAAGDRAGVVLNEGAGSELKLLFVGDSTMAGVGVQDQTAALAFQVASILSNRLSRSVRWQLLAQSGLNTRLALEFVKEQELLPADVLVTSLGVNDVTSQRTPYQFVTAFEALIQGIFQRVGATYAVICGLPPMHLFPVVPEPLRWYLGRCSDLLDDHLRRWIAPRRNLAYLSTRWSFDPTEMAADGYHPGKNLYGKWAGLVADKIVDLLSQQRVENQTQGG